MFGLSLLSGVRRYLGELCELMVMMLIGKGKLSLCFKWNGNLFVTFNLSPRVAPGSWKESEG